MVFWGWYVGYFLVVASSFFYLATRKRYRDKTAAPNYEAVRNKVTVREEVKPEEVEEYSSSGFSLGILISAFVVLLVGFGLIGPISEQVNSLTVASGATNVTAVSGLASTVLSIVPAFFILAIIMAVIGAILAGLKRTGLA